MSRPYLDPDLLTRLSGLELRSRSAVAGSYAGQHRSAYHGNSVEFAQHRLYTPGDDIRHVDWRIFGKKDRFYVKQYEAETNLRCTFLLDASRSMAFRGSDGDGERKFDYAARLAASLAYLLVGQQDAVGLVLFDQRIRTELPVARGRRHLREFVSLLEQVEPQDATHVRVLFQQLADQLRRRSMVVLISDLLADADEIVEGLQRIAVAGHELIVLHVMHPEEWDFPFVENVRFEGLEEDERLLVEPRALRAGYLRAVERYTRRLRTVCLRHRADYVPVNMRDHPGNVLCGYLAHRAGLSAEATRR